MLLNVVSLVKSDGQVGGPRRDVAAVLFTSKVDEVDAPVGEHPRLVEGGRTGDNVEDASAGVHQRQGRLEAAASGLSLIHI